jgi:hypothetical protein
MKNFMLLVLRKILTPVGYDVHISLGRDGMDIVIITRRS